MQKTFEQWKKEADQICSRDFGLSLEDLEDCCYRDWYEDGISPKVAVKRAIQNSILNS